MFFAASATKAGSLGSGFPGTPCFTAQKRQLRVQQSPRIKKVAVFFAKHSPRLGHRASWQTVCILLLFIIPRTSWIPEPDSILRFNQEGLFPKYSWLDLGENPEEIGHTMQDLLVAGCHILTIGQYLQPSKDHLKVQRFIPPEEFEYWRKTAQELGLSAVTSGPFVRSSYHAEEIYRSIERNTVSTS